MNLENKKGGLMDLPINLLYMFIVVTFFVALLPGFIDMIDLSKGNSYLNCKNYFDWDSTTALGGTGNESYKSAVGEKSSIACLAMNLYVPYIALAVLIGVVGYLFMKQPSQQQYPEQGPSMY